MRKKGSVCDYVKERNMDLERVYRRVISETGASNVLEVFSGMAMMPARRFYISEPRAYELICHHRRAGRWPARMSATRLRMMSELKRRTESIMESDGGISLIDAVYKAVNSPAPSFYLTPGSIKTIFYRMR